MFMFALMELELTARHRGRVGLDAIEPAQTKRRQDTVHLARIRSLLGRFSG